ncbi:MAG: phosphotransferase [Wenzhouxiangellaceae bacterium]|nr:phosphotransferase [Wenzhouxiangellaceae bacterium]
MSRSPRFITLDRALSGWRDWQLSMTQKPRVLGKVAGGLTNRNYRLQAAGRDQHLLLRLNHPDPKRLGIDRAREHRIVDEVARHGIGRPMLYRDPNDRFAVFPWVEARPWTVDDRVDPQQRARLWPLLDALAELDLPLPRRRYGAYLDHYWQQVERRGRADVASTEAWRAFRTRLQAFDESDWTACLTHHDLVPANILDSGHRLILIDWEYAAIGHPDIDRWSIDPNRVREPFIAELMGWINDLWARLIRDDSRDRARS